MPRKALIIIGPEFEDIEALYPMYRLLEIGFKVDIAAPWKGKITGKHGYSVEAEKTLAQVNPEEYETLVIPGGRGPERIRVYARNDAIRIVQHFMDNRKPVAAICHGPQLLITANRVKGYRLTSYPGIADDVKAAGGIWVDEPVVVDKNLVTARIPDDIPFWIREYIKLLKTT